MPKDSFKELITNTDGSAISIIGDILTTVYNSTINRDIFNLMNSKNISTLDKYNESLNERYKFTIERKLIYNNKRYILETALAVQSTFLTAKGFPIYKLSLNDTKQLYYNLKNLNKKYNFINMNELPKYKNFILLISGFSTFFKAVDENWEFDETDRTINYDPENEKYDIYVKYPIIFNSSILNEIPRSHIFKVQFDNNYEPTIIDKYLYDELINFERERWQSNINLSNNRNSGE